VLDGIQAAVIPAAWPLVAADIAAALERARGKLEAGDVFVACLTGEMQLWIWRTPTARAVIVTQITNYKRKRVGQVVICVGENVQEWARPALSRIEEWARANGCGGMELVARPGWRRIFPEYEQTHIFMERDL